MQNEPQNYPKHYCGVFGVFGHPNASELAYYGLYALQHRGQESAGIVTCHEGKFYKHHGMGLVPQIFNDPKILHDLVGDRAIGHTRYSTTGSSQLRNAQPLTVDCARGQIAVAHNGNLTNAAVLRDELESRGLVFQTTVDSEIIIMMLAQPTMGGINNSLVQTLRRIEGAFSLVIMTEKELIGARDPHGFRPLSIGKTASGAWVLSSETTAFDLIHAKFVRDVEPGEIVIINDAGLTSNGCRVVDALEVEPDVLPCVGSGNLELVPVPVILASQALGDNFGPVVLSVKRLGIDIVIDQSGENGAGYSGFVPTSGVEASSRDLCSGLRHLGGVLHLPSGRKHDSLIGNRLCIGGNCRHDRNGSGEN